MKILHITNELTKKNFSIASLILFLSRYLYQSYKFEYSILASQVEKKLFYDKNINTIKLITWISIFFKTKDLIKIFQILISFIFMVFGPQFKYFLF